MPSGAVGATLVGEMALWIVDRAEPADTALARELGARKALALAIVRAQATYVLASRRLTELDEHLDWVRLRLRAGGYLAPPQPRTDRSKKGAPRCQPSRT